MQQFSILRPERIIETQRRLRDRIRRRFPDAGLGAVADELLAVAEKAGQRSESIRTPIVALRVGVYFVLLLGLIIGVWVLTSLRLQEDLSVAFKLLQFCESALAVIVFLGAAVLFLITFETRLKRRRAMKALHELRAFAHVVDMHQLTKDPEGILKRVPHLSQGPEQTTKTLHDLNRYLSYCNELLAITSKIAALYVQGFPDVPTVSAVDQIESLCSALAHKIWQKLMILDQAIEEHT